MRLATLVAAFGLGKETKMDEEVYLVVPNSHSAIFCKEYRFPFRPAKPFAK